MLQIPKIFKNQKTILKNKHTTLIPAFMNHLDFLNSHTKFVKKMTNPTDFEKEIYVYNIAKSKHRKALLLRNYVLMAKKLTSRQHKPKFGMGAFSQPEKMIIVDLLYSARRYRPAHNKGKSKPRFLRYWTLIQYICSIFEQNEFPLDVIHTTKANSEKNTS